MSDPSAYTVGWICAVETELVAAQVFLDDEHTEPIEIPVNDNNNYTLGRIGPHNVVIAALPHWQYGLTSAANVARDMVRSFPNVRIGLMVGIGGGVPTNHDIRLGDVVVSSPGYGNGGVFQYDYGIAMQGQGLSITGTLNQAPVFCLTAMSTLKARYMRKGHQLEEMIQSAIQSNHKLAKQFSRPHPSTDRLYEADLIHALGNASCATVCGESRLITRTPRQADEDDPKVHYGLIASGNQLMKDAGIRDRLSTEKDVLCFEMEAAGLSNHFPCVVIRGICDYSDSHKNLEWQGYAAMVAAAYAKELLLQIPPNKVEAERRISETLDIIKEKVNEIERATFSTEAAVDHIKSDRQTENIKRWLCPPDPSTNINQAKKLRHEGTGQWLLNTTFFQSWCSGSVRHLWLYGFAGCGKTVLSATVLDHLTKTNDKLLISFYFDFGDITKQTVDGMLRSLAFQMYEHGAAFKMHLDALFQSHHGGRDQPSTNALSEVVYTMFKGDKFFVVLDALDESTTRSELLQWIGDIASSPDLHHVQLLCTSRPESEFQHDLPELIGQGNCSLIDKQAVNADVRAYVTSQLENRREFKIKSLSEDLFGLIQRKVGDGADGMFRWAACQMDSLAECPNPRAIKNALERLPKDLNETYHRMLQGIPEELRNSATRLLQFLVYSRRPLTVPEAVEVIATEIEADSRCFHIDNRVFDGNEVLRYCPGLMSIVEAAERNGKIKKELHLAHFSVKEFLESQVDFERLRASIIITQTCLTYLTDITGTSNIKQDFPMAQFAAETWTSHGASAESEWDVCRAMLMFLEEYKTFQRWGRLYQADRSWDDDPGPPEGSRLYYACLAGLVKVAQELIIRGADINAQGGHYGNALQGASYTGHGEIVKLLLDNGANVNAQGGGYGNALQAASYNGHYEMVKLLLDNGANVNAQGGYGNALQAASYNGHDEIVKLLLDNGVNINAQGGEYGNALHAASSNGDHEIVKLLLDNGANVSAQGGYYGNALQAASYNGHDELVKLLLDNGANINAQGGEYGNALQAASSNGYGEIVKLLLDNGANVNAQGGEYGNALQASSSNGHGEIVKLFLDNGANVNAQDSYYGNALQASSSNGYGEIVKLLLDNGANVNAQGGHYGNALQGASFHGHGEMVKLLLDNGANVNAQGGYYGNALQAASHNGNGEILKVLLDNGANVSAQGGS
ncbi:hypothetical protein S40293_09448 [Stachybotrys chartarum IBT 40293]|nr:hypothetical protein S40293_09448 [Stachybotrys chartarum IBT 40293]